MTNLSRIKTHKRCKHTAFLIFLFSIVLISQNNPHKAPLYWSVYEHHIVKEQNGVFDNYIPESELMANIDWIDENLKDLGFSMICMDGWGDVSNINENGYRSSHSEHWEHNFEWWSNYLQSRGMLLGMYGNPLWIHVDQFDTTKKIVGTDINVSSLIDPNEESLWFTWAQVNRPGAEEYVKGYIQYYADMGIKYFRVDFLSWFETGYDRYLGTVGPNRPREYYETALRWMREACDSNGMFLSLVMPNLFNEAELEKKYGHMFRINEDTGYGEWWKFSEKDRGHRFDEWSQYANAFDGFTYWSQVTGRNKVILDGDFIRINTFETDSEKRTVISAHLIAGGPLTISDQYNTIGDDIRLYQNVEMLELNYDGFVGKPLTNDPTNMESQIWTGQMSSGDWIVALFNRESETQTRSFNFSDLGFVGEVLVRDLWQHSELGMMGSITAGIPPHGCLILKISDEVSSLEKQEITFASIEDKVYGEGDFELSAVSSSRLPVEFEIALGPAAVEGNIVKLNGQSGKVFVVAKQPGDETYSAAIPKVQSFNVTGGHQPQMYIAGTFTDWNLNIEMYLANDIWVAEDVQISAGNHELKFANTNNWSGDDWGNATGLSGTARLATGGDPNISFSIYEGGTFDIYFNDISLEYSIGSEMSAVDESKDIPLNYELSQNYPNPFNPATIISFTVANLFHDRQGGGNVKLIVYDILGREVKILVNQILLPGSYEVKFDGSNLPSGTYFYTLISGHFTQAKKMLLVK